MSAGAYGGAYAGGGVHHAGAGGGGLHSLVDTMCEKFGSHAAELIPGVATVTAAIGTIATATTSAARRRINLVIVVGLPEEPVPDLCSLQLMPSPCDTTDLWGE